MEPFIHLHVHSQYSLLDGQAPIDALVKKAVADGMPGMALTDHGNMFGIKEFANFCAKHNKKVKENAKKLRQEADAARQAGDEEKADQLEADAAKQDRKHFKPIFGCEMYVAQRSMHETVDKTDRGRHLIVLAKNKTGYKNLIKLVSQAWTEGFYNHPRTDKEHLAKHREGLIIASACLGGEIPKLIAAGDIEGAEASVRWWKETFGDDYYIELQRHKAQPGGNTETYEVQQQVNPELIRIARKYDIKLICTNDSHFVDATDAEAHDHLICISTNSDFNNPTRMRYSKQEWFKTQAEMNEVFADIPEALSNTLEILAKVEEYSIDHAPIMPNFEIPKEFGTEEEYRQRLTEQDLFDEFTRDEHGNVVMDDKAAHDKIEKLGGYDKLYRIKFEADYLRKLAYEGAKRRYGELTLELDERINFELHIMKTMGFPGYFLIVQDFINAAREQLGVSVGPGRGSAAGSCVAYCLGITQIDPIKYDLLFERFLNPDRISLPDIDIDFDDDGRADVLRWVTRKYGEEKVAHIITYGTMAAKSAIKDVARIEKLPLSESNRLTKLIPAHMPEVNGKELKPTLSNCLEYLPEFKAEMEGGNPLIARTLDYARQLEGNVRNLGVHACGVIICRDDITDWVPVSTAVDKESGDKSKLIVTQYEGRVIEETGLIKMDFLGLKTLSILKEAVNNIKLTRGIDIDLDNIPIDDPATYRLYSEGRTTGTFQFESAGMQKYLRELQPTTFEDLIAMNALYRPGPMDYIPDFIARKHGRSPIVYDIPIMEKYLKDTYGVTVYQEQVMLLSRLLAGFTRGQSDTLRKAMGKKLIDKMNELKGLFLEGGQKNGHDPKVLSKIWADWEKFASYAFNKSHATCYSWVAFQTAYLKANYPAEYMAAVLTRNLSDLNKCIGFMDECKKMHISVKGPDVNESFIGYGVNSKGDIRFGLAAIKGVGEGVVADILRARQDGPFKDVYDFVERVNPGTLNRRVLEALVLAGALDCFSDIRREDYFSLNAKGESFTELLLRYGQAYQNDKAQNAMSLFGDDDLGACTTAGRPPYMHGETWPDAIRLEKEKDYVGIYLSAHPLDPYFVELNYGCTTTLKEFGEIIEPVENTTYTLGGMVLNFETRMTKKGEPFGILKVEDMSGSYEFKLFGQSYIDYHNYGIPGTPVLITGAYQRRFPTSDPMFKLLSVRLLSDVKGKLTSKLTIKLSPSGISETVRSLIKDFRHDDPRQAAQLAFDFYDPKINRHISMTSSWPLRLNKALIDMLNAEEIEFAVS